MQFCQTRYFLVDAFEMWCRRRVVRVSGMERKTNVRVLENMKPERTLESRVAQAALKRK